MSSTPDQILSAVRRRQQSLIQLILWGLLAIVMLAMVLNVLILWPSVLDLRTLLPNLALLGLVGLSLWLNNRGHSRQALGVIITVTMLAAGLPLLLGGVTGNETILFLFLIPIALAGLLMHRSSLLTVGALTVAVVIGALLLEEFGVTEPARAPTESTLLVEQFILVLLVLLFLLERFSLTLYDALGDSARREAALAREVAERRQAEARLALAMQVARIATYELDPETLEVTGSHGLPLLFGLPPRGGKRPRGEYLERVHPEDRPIVEANVDQLRTRTGENRQDFRVLLRDGEVRWLSGISRNARLPDGRPGPIIGVVIDTTEIMSAQIALQQMNETLEGRVEERTRRLQSAYAELEAFTYSASHDLRAPLRGIDGFTQALLDDYGPQLDETARGYLRRVRAAAVRMGDIIDDLLRLSYISRTELKIVPVDLAALARRVHAEFEEREPERRVALEVRGEATVPADEKLLTIVMENLIGNAWKFTRHREAPAIEVEVERAGDEWRVAVTDNGAGFDMEFAEKMFSPFTRLHRPEEFEGTGIGLALVQRIVRRHGGSVGAQGAPGEGATVTFTLPAENDAVPA